MTGVAEPLAALEAWAAEELGAQESLRGSIRALEQAVHAGDPGAVAERTAALESGLSRVVARAQRRDLMVRKLAAAWGADPSALTLSSIVERAGGGGGRLAGLRRDLRRSTAEVTHALRRAARAARLHHEVWSEVLERIVAACGRGAGGCEGRLVDAEA